MGEKKIILVCTKDKEKHTEIAYEISQNITDATIYQAQDGMDALFKVDNAPPHLFICDIELPKISGVDVAKKMIKSHEKMAIILVGALPKQESLVNEVVNGQLQFLESHSDKEKFKTVLKKALNFISFGEAKGYRIVFFK